MIDSAKKKGGNVTCSDRLLTINGPENAEYVQIVNSDVMSPLLPVTTNNTVLLPEMFEQTGIL